MDDIRKNEDIAKELFFDEPAEAIPLAVEKDGTLTNRLADKFGEQCLVALCEIIAGQKEEIRELRKRRVEAMEIAQEYKEKYEALRDEVR